MFGLLFLPSPKRRPGGAGRVLSRLLPALHRMRRPWQVSTAPTARADSENLRLDVSDSSPSTTPSPQMSHGFAAGTAWRICGMPERYRFCCRCGGRAQRRGGPRFSGTSPITACATEIWPALSAGQNTDVVLQNNLVEITIGSLGAAV